MVQWKQAGAVLGVRAPAPWPRRWTRRTRGAGARPSGSPLASGGEGMVNRNGRVPRRRRTASGSIRGGAWPLHHRATGVRVCSPLPRVAFLRIRVSREHPICGAPVLLLGALSTRPTPAPDLVALARRALLASGARPPVRVGLPQTVFLDGLIGHLRGSRTEGARGVSMSSSRLSSLGHHLCAPFLATSSTPALSDNQEGRPLNGRVRLRAVGLLLYFDLADSAALCPSS